MEAMTDVLPAFLQAHKQLSGLNHLVSHWDSAKPLADLSLLVMMPVHMPTVIFLKSICQLGAKVRFLAVADEQYTDRCLAMLEQEQDVTCYIVDVNHPESTFHKAMAGEDPAWKPQLVIDDEGILTAFLHEEYPDKLQDLKGLVMLNPKGCSLLATLKRNANLMVPCLALEGSKTKARFEDYYSCRDTVIGIIQQSTGMALAGKVVLVIGYGRVGKGCAAALRYVGARVAVAEIDPICALQAAMSGFWVTTFDHIADKVDLVITASGCPSVIHADHLLRMKDQAILANVGLDLHEIDIDSLRKFPWQPVHAGLSRIDVTDNKSIFLLAEGKLINRLHHGINSSLIASLTMSNALLATIELARSGSKYPIGIHCLSREMDEEVARVHLASLQAELSVLTNKQAQFLGCSPEGPFKNDDYLY